MEKITKATYKHPLHPNGDKFTMTPARVGHLNEVIDSVNNLEKEYYISGYFEKAANGEYVTIVSDHNLPISNLSSSFTLQNSGDASNKVMLLGRWTQYSRGTTCKNESNQNVYVTSKINSYQVFPTKTLIEQFYSVNGKSFLEIVSEPDYTGANRTDTAPLLGSLTCRVFSAGGTPTFADTPTVSNQNLTFFRFEVRFSELTLTLA